MVEKTKITYVIPSLDAGGAERFILDLIKNLDQSRFSPSLILFDHGGFFLEEAMSLEIPIYTLKKRWRFDPFNFISLLIKLKKLRPDIVHTQLGGDVYGRLAAKLLGVKGIISTEQNVNPQEGSVYNLCKTVTARFAKYVVAISRAVKQDLIDRYQLPEEKIKIIYNGLEINKFWGNAYHRRPGEAIIFGSIGRLSQQKNFGTLIEALSLLKDRDFLCLIAGDGQLRPALEKQIKDFGLGEKIKLVGLQKDISAFLEQLDFFVLPSLWEGLGVVLLEAGLKGLPILASRVDGIKEIITDQQTGILFEPQRAVDMAEKLEFAFSHIDNPEFRSLGDRLQAEIKERFDIIKIANQYQNLYQQLII